MATPDEIHGSDSDNILSESLGLDTLEARSMVPDAYCNARDAEVTCINSSSRSTTGANIEMNTSAPKTWLSVSNATDLGDESLKA